MSRSGGELQSSSSPDSSSPVDTSNTSDRPRRSIVSSGAAEASSPSSSTTASRRLRDPREALCSVAGGSFPAPACDDGWTAASDSPVGGAAARGVACLRSFDRARAADLSRSRFQTEDQSSSCATGIAFDWLDPRRQRRHRRRTRLANCTWPDPSTCRAVPPTALAPTWKVIQSHASGERTAFRPSAGGEFSAGQRCS